MSKPRLITALLLGTSVAGMWGFSVAFASHRLLDDAKEILEVWKPGDFPAFYDDAVKDHKHGPALMQTLRGVDRVAGEMQQYSLMTLTNEQHLLLVQMALWAVVTVAAVVGAWFSRAAL